MLVEARRLVAFNRHVFHVTLVFVSTKTNQHLDTFWFVHHIRDQFISLRLDRDTHGAKF